MAPSKAKCGVSKLTVHPLMDHKLRARLSQFHTLFQHELVPLTEACLGERLTPKLEQLLRIWEMIQIERFVPAGRGGVGRPARERTALARAFVAKAVLGLPTTVALIERLHVDPYVSTYDPTVSAGFYL